MACSYDPSHGTPRDYVRFLIGDTDVPDGCLLEDEEIDALLTEVVTQHGSSNGTVYCAAALAWEHRLAKASMGGVKIGPIVEKQVGRLRLRSAEALTSAEAVSRIGDYLRERCAWYMTPKPRAFASMGSYRRRR